MRVYEVRRSSRPRRLWVFVPLGIVVVIAALVYLLVAQRMVVPGLTERLYPIRYQEGISRVAERYGVDPYLIAAVARTESGYDPEAVSHAGAVGVMQLMPDTAEWIVGLAGWKGGQEPDLTDPDDNLELGAFYLAYLLERFDGDRRAAIAAYNAGPNVVAQWVSGGDGGGIDLANVRFPETLTFVERVEEFVALYEQLHPGVFAEGAGGG